MILNTQTIEADQDNHNRPVVLLHGLFGSLSNLGVIARALSDEHKVIQFDLRNHGLSPHSDEMNYELMAQDVIDTLNEQGIDQFSLIGHSMGGKVSMKIAGLYADRVAQLVVLDISPVAYQKNHHQAIFAALNAVRSQPHELNRKQATEIMQQYITDAGVILFLLKSFHQGHWLFNVDVLQAQYANILGWNTIEAYQKPSLFIRGAESKYIQPEYEPLIQQQFPLADIETVAAAGHWLHAEQPEKVLSLIQDYLD